MRIDRRLSLCAAVAVACLSIADAAPSVPDSGAYSKVALPVSDPPGGSLADTSTVTLSCPTPWVTLLYTLDGTDPDTAAGGATRLYDQTHPEPLRLRGTTVLKARAVKPGWIPSDVMTARFTADPVLDVARGGFREARAEGSTGSAPGPDRQRAGTVPHARVYRRGAAGYDARGARLPDGP